MFESRCGICCRECEKKVETQCKGCLNMKEPYWGGICLVKTCCEEQELNHCGECKSFPCDVLSDLGKEYGYDPNERLEMCRRWLNESKRKKRIRLHYKKGGQGRPLIMVHGNGESHAIFAEAANYLKDDFTVYVVDLRGHGKSTPVQSYHYQDMAEDIYQMIIGLNLEKPLFCGFSDGGIIGLLLAVQHPALFSKMVICGANTKPEGIKTIWRSLFWLQYQKTHSLKIRMILREPHISDEMLRKIQIPVFVTAGSKDMIKETETKHIAKMIPKSRMDIFPGETHGSYVCHSEKIASYIKETVMKEELNDSRDLYIRL